jgi:hypothetical protein
VAARQGRGRAGGGGRPSLERCHQRPFGGRARLAEARRQDGAALALELPRLRGLDTWPAEEVQAALRGYEDRRLAQASRVQRNARFWGEIWHVDGLAMALRDEALRLRAEDDFTRIDWLYADSQASS